ncbi:MAG: hypothetical protein AB7T48_02720 [Solirubrobacterales bacterium]
MLRKLRVFRGGEELSLKKAERNVLYALVMSRAELSKEALIEVLPPEQKRKGKVVPRNDSQTLSQALSWCRGELGLNITRYTFPVMLESLQPHVSIDLWSFLDHMDDGELAAAEEVLERSGDDPVAPDGLAKHAALWNATLSRFQRQVAKLRSATREGELRRGAIAARREELLDMLTSPGVGSPLPLRDVRAEIERLPLPWGVPNSTERLSDAPLPDYLASLLTTERSAAGMRLMLIGRPGAGKTLASRLVFLQLAERFLAEQEAESVPALLYFDAIEEENSSPEFATDAWLEKVIEEAGGQGGPRPIVIIAHADRLLSNPEVEPRELFSRRLFRECDTLVCFGDHLYASRVSKEEYGRHVIQVRPLGPEEQSQCAEALFDSATREAFEAWRDEKDDGTRTAICGTPLHLAYVLDFVASDPAALERISTHWHFFDQVARMRLNRGGIGADDEDARFDELAALAHHFYSAAHDRPIGFSRSKLRAFLKKRDPRDVAARTDALIHRTLLSAPEPASNEIRFETASWGWFFVASHLASAVLGESPEAILRSFSKFVSSDIADLCESMLAEDLAIHVETIHSALWSALQGGLDAGLRPSGLRVARMQIAYLLAKLDDVDTREDLLALLEPASDPREEDAYVRTAIAYGFANGGDGAVADRQVERMTTRGRPPAQDDEREANVHLTLSFRGADEFSPARFRERDGEIDAAPAVAALVRLLEDEAHRGSWRLRIFSLTELRSHRAVDVSSVLWALDRHRKRIRAILEAREEDPLTRDWSELGWLRQIVDA